MINLFPDEKIISTSEKDQVILTTHRICYEYKDWGKSYNQSIMLEHITSCENHSKNKYWLLIIAIFAFIFAIYSMGGNNVDSSLLGIAMVIMLVFFYFATRSNFIVIGSPSTKMKINVQGMKRENVLSFINKIEQTKHTRLLDINNKA